ncbi:hypothetical protein VIGAN_01429800 [Vigna angularis var. angularis]|uniref:Uncharacterized protein n=1 Tax=Vigna angularis var. angularis TaxID=157739 RepID=A0A0S3R6R9_PHAAN|nr:hypothetical protein VIGAN_01429800 [Vigna angularis var. angularis]
MPWHSCSHTLFCGSIKLWEDTDRSNNELAYLKLQILPLNLSVKLYYYIHRDKIIMVYLFFPFSSDLTYLNLFQI